MLIINAKIILVIKLKKRKLLVLLVSVCLLCGCGKDVEKTTDTTKEQNEGTINDYNNVENPIVSMKIKNYGTIRIELYPKYAPNTVANFVNLIEDGFYDGLTFHRLVPGFVLQGGDPNGNGTGGPEYTIEGEFRLNGFKQNTLSHTKGVISMARSQAYDSAGSQFFIVLDDSATYSLDNMYAGFGKVIEGMEILEKIAKNEKVANEKTGALEKNITITKVTVDTKGETYKVKKITN